MPTFAPTSGRQPSPPAARVVSSDNTSEPIYSSVMKLAESIRAKRISAAEAVQDLRSRYGPL